MTNVSNVAAEESLLIDGVSVDLVNGTTSTTNGSATVNVAGGIATVTLTLTPGISASAMETLVNGITYTNNNVGLDEAARDVTITSLRDTGGTTPGDDTANPGITSTVVFNQPPAITSNGAGPTAAVSIDENTTAVANVDANDPDAGPGRDHLFDRSRRGRWVVRDRSQHRRADVQQRAELREPARFEHRQ